MRIRAIHFYAFLELIAAHKIRGALWSQESADFFSDFLDRPRLDPQPLENTGSRSYMKKYKFWRRGMCDTWLERYWGEEQTLQKNLCSKNNFKGSNLDLKFFISAFLNIPNLLNMSWLDLPSHIDDERHIKMFVRILYTLWETNK